MIFSRVDWVVTWKLFHDQFFWIYLALGIPLRFFAIRHLDSLGSKRSLSVMVASLASSIFSTWLPILPIICGAALYPIAGRAVSESLLIGVPVVAISMGIETALLDAVLFRVLLKESIKKRLMSLLIVNVVNASLALALGLAWAFRHMPIFLAAAGGWC